MAEALVFAVLQKIAVIVGEEVVKTGTSKLFKEVSELRAVRYNIKQIQSEFDVMQGFLRKVDVQASNDQSFARWLEKVREVAYDVEDIIDEYAFLIGQKRSKRTIAQKAVYYVKKGKTWHDMATQLKEVRGHLDHLTQMRERYGITIPEGSRSNRSNDNRLPNMSDYSHLVDENDIVGHLDERNRLIQWLTNTHKDQAIISIQGMGGSGKTTLISGIYKEQKEIFECCAFISVSQTFQVEDLLRSTIKQILEKEGKRTTEFDRTDRASLEKTIHTKLENKRYLIVLDDVWRREAWLLLSRAFPKNNKGSRVVITTRIEDVASLADENWLIKMRALSKEEARELFYKKAFGKLKDRTCPQELVGWAEKIVDRCQGLPLAIVAIGSLLSFRRMEETQWRLFYNQLSWELSNNPELSSVANVLNLSYDNLPTYLKSCFLYCSLFPEDYLIPRKWIIRLMIAEGFIEDRGPEITMEEVAEGYLVELAHRSLLQVVERNVYGRAKRFRMHDLVRDMCISKAKCENFGIGCDNQLSPLECKARRIFIHNMSEDLPPSVELSKLRSLHFFWTEQLLPGIKGVLENLRLLRVLSLIGCDTETLPNVVFELFNLHYLDLSFTEVKVLPKSLGKLKLLETLDVRRTLVEKLPSEVSELSKLRHLLSEVSIDDQARQYDSFIGLSVTSNICNLRDLITLCDIEANDDIVQGLQNLEKLRNLFLLKVKASHIGDLWFSIRKIQFLSALGIIACNKDEVLNLQNVSPMPSLEKLYLKGKLEGGIIPSIFGSFTKMRVLKLGWLGLREDPLISFSHMSNLVELHLYRIFEGSTLTFRSGWFPKLQMLYLADLFELVCIDFEDGTMGSLHYMELIGLSKLTRVPEGMRCLRTLKKLILTDMPGQFMSNLEEDKWEILHGNHCHLPDQTVTRDHALYRFFLYYSNVTVISFLNCTQEIEDPRYKQVPCLNRTNSRVYAMASRSFLYTVSEVHDSCSLVGRAMTDYIDEPLEGIGYASIMQAIEKGILVKWTARRIYWKGLISCSYFEVCSKRMMLPFKQLKGFSEVLLLSLRPASFLPLLLYLVSSFLGCLYSSFNATIIFMTIFSVLFGIALLMLLARIFLTPLAVFSFLIHKWWRMSSSVSAIETFLRRNELLHVKRYDFIEISIMTNHFREKLGQGGFGSVYKGGLLNSQQVAVKILSNPIGDGDDFISEVATIGRIHHTNIVRLIGFCSEGSRRALIYAYMPNGSLDNYIFSSSNNALSMEKRREIATSAAIYAYVVWTLELNYVQLSVFQLPFSFKC